MRQMSLADVLPPVVERTGPTSWIVSYADGRLLYVRHAADPGRVIVRYPSTDGMTVRHAPITDVPCPPDTLHTI